MKKILLLSAIIVSGGFISCKQNDIENGTSGQRKEVKFNSNITSINEPKTRMAGQTWHTGDSIGIFMLNETGSELVESKENVKYINDKESTVGAFKPESEIIYFPDNGSEVVFMSYYPYKKDIADNIYKINVLSQNNQSAIDLLHSFDKEEKYDKTTEDKLVTLVFTHQLTKININVKRGDDLPEGYLDDLTVHFEGLKTIADFNLMSGLLSSADNTANISTKAIAAVNEYEASFEAIVLPVNPTGAKIVFNLNNGDGGSDDAFSWAFNNELFEKSTEYNYNVTIKRTGIVVEATINPWIDGGENEIDAE